MEVKRDRCRWIWLTNNSLIKCLNLKAIRDNMISCLPWFSALFFKVRNKIVLPLFQIQIRNKNFLIFQSKESKITVVDSCLVNALSRNHSLHSSPKILSKISKLLQLQHLLHWSNLKDNRTIIWILMNTCMTSKLLTCFTR